MLGDDVRQARLDAEGRRRRAGAAGGRDGFGPAAAQPCQGQRQARIEQPADRQRPDRQGQKDYVVIEPASPTEIYVPYYQPAVVYGNWPYPAYPPLYFAPPPGYVTAGALAAGVAFGAGVAAGYAIWGNCNWAGHNINVVSNRSVNINNFNRNTANFNKWEHNPDHRHGVRYNNDAVRQKYARTDAQAGRRGPPGFPRQERRARARSRPPSGRGRAPAEPATRPGDGDRDRPGAANVRTSASGKVCSSATPAAASGSIATGMAHARRQSCHRRPPTRGRVRPAPFGARHPGAFRPRPPKLRRRQQCATRRRRRPRPSLSPQHHSQSRGDHDVDFRRNCRGPVCERAPGSGLRLWAVAAVCLWAMVSAAGAQQLFKTPDDAAKALAEAAKSGRCPGRHACARH